MTRKTATAAKTAETFSSAIAAVLDGAPAETALAMLGVAPKPAKEPSALRALVSDWKASNPEPDAIEADTVRKAEPSGDDKARAGKRSKRAPKHEPGNPGGCPELHCEAGEPARQTEAYRNAFQVAMEEGLDEEAADQDARDASTGTAKRPTPRPAPAPKAPRVELDAAPTAAKAAKAARKPATPVERKERPAKGAKPAKAAAREVSAKAKPGQAAAPQGELAGIIEAATAKYRAAGRVWNAWRVVRLAGEACAAAPEDQGLRAKLSEAIRKAEAG